MVPSEAGADLHRDVQEVLRSGLFERAYYGVQADMPSATAEEAVAHYLDAGWRLLMDPGPRFSTAEYLDRNPDVRSAGVNPLQHFIRYGRAENRHVEPAAAGPARVYPKPVAVAPGAADWERLAAHSAAHSAARPAAPDEVPIDVIVPVYKGLAETCRCLYSVLAANVSVPFRLVVVDDHGPEPALRERLAWLAERDLIVLVRTPENGGFVRACNLGMGLHPARDVLLLNADTEVFDGWLDRMRAAAYRHPSTGTVTPFSNNAEICSYPYFVRDNWQGLEISDRELDGLFAAENADGEVDIPTGVGFCMYVRRDCLDAVGLLDVEAFGEGYGEENDLCRRIAAIGRRNILCADVFVRHYGAASFGASKLARVSRAIATVERLHPGYLAEVQAFVAADPVAPWRAAVDLARLERLNAGRQGAVLFVLHNRGGGTERHVREMASLLESVDVPAILGRPDRSDPWKLTLSAPRLRLAPNALALDLRQDPELFAEHVRRLGIRHVHIHHLADFAEQAADYLRLAIGAAGLAYDVTLHDYMPFCPRISLTDGDGVYCGEPPSSTCHACIEREGSPFGRVAIWEWRARHQRLLRGARRVFVPADDVARRMRRHFPGIRFVTRPHLGAPVDRRPARAGAAGHEEILQVALLGALGPHKGSGLVLACARRAAERALPIHFTIVGYTDRDAAFSDCSNVSILGRYHEDDLPGLVAGLDAGVAWFPATWPETYSYTLSAAFAAGVPPVAFDFGAIAERIRRSGFGRLLPIDTMLDPDAVLDALLRAGRDPVAESPGIAGTEYADPLRSYYELA